jgi:hypothetical protein
MVVNCQKHGVTIYPWKSTGVTGRAPIFRTPQTCSFLSSNVSARLASWRFVTIEAN